jgi:putative DNA primase/helicase
MPEVFAAALALWRSGLSVIPVSRDGSKRPAVPWKEYQSRKATEAELRTWFDRAESFGIGVACGAVSGGLIVFDFEERPAFDRWARAVNETAPGCLDGLPMAETPGGGRHVWFRTGGPVPAGSKLAQRKRADGDGLECVAETRGEGHYVVCPGSPADVHESGNPYRWLRKGWLGGN